MKTQMALILLGLVCGSAYAAYGEEAPMSISNDINVTAPDQAGTWSFGATAVLMQPTNNEFIYAATEDTPLNSGLPMSDTLVGHPSVDQSYYWWFGADVSYAFAGNGRDVTLAYEGLHGSDSDSSSTDTEGFLVSSFTGVPYLDAEGKVDTTYDAGDILLGQKMDVGTRVRVHPFVGLRYAYINTNDRGYFSNGFPPQAPSGENDKLDNTFNGIGPRFGSDAAINLGAGFSLRARLGLSALIGSHKIDNSATLLFDGESPVITVDNKSETLVIPEIDGRLGLNYTYNFDANTALGFEAGWQATTYFNVIYDQPSLDDILNERPGNHYNSTTNFGLQGPYARLQLDIS